MLPPSFLFEFLHSSRSNDVFPAVLFEYSIFFVWMDRNGNVSWKCPRRSCPDDKVDVLIAETPRKCYVDGRTRVAFILDFGFGQSGFIHGTPEYGFQTA